MNALRPSERGAAPITKEPAPRMSYNDDDHAAFVEELFGDERFNGFPLSSHKLMLQDRQRVGRFARALRQVVRPGDTVVDAGTGILAFLALRCGAGRVIGIDSSPVVRAARAIAKRNFPDADVQFLQRHLLTGRLPRVRADVIVCELLGQFGIDEGCAAVIRRLRHRLLKRGGRVIPEQVRLRVAPVESPAVFEEFSFWRKRYRRMDLSPLLDFAYQHVYLFSQHPMRMLAAPRALATLDSARDAAVPEAMTCRFPINRPGTLHGFVGWFDARLSEGVSLSTDPRRRNSHWHQVFFPLGPPMRVQRGEHVSFELTIEGDPVDGQWRWRGGAHANGREPDNGHASSRHFDLGAT